ncbi:hypothetical protein B7494_g2878 [Chlorociboria aeruginascens]|nr:hypothetical protein B7494_g2878 [Chlorociboria aeruginascens]
MHPTLLGILAISATVYAVECVNNDLDQLVSRTSCVGNHDSLTTCLFDNMDIKAIEQCFFAYGCDETEAEVEANWFINECYEEENGELRKRATDTVTTSAATNEKAATATQQTTTKTSSPATTEATTTDTSATTSTSSDTTSTTSSAPTSTTTSSSTTSSSLSTVTSTVSTSSSSTNTCSTTKTLPTKACSTYMSGASAGKTYSCTSTSYTTATCLPNMLCSTNANSEPICMLQQNSLTSSGKIVTIVFATAIGIFIMGMIFMSVQSRRESAKAQAEQDSKLEAESLISDKPHTNSDVEGASTFAQNGRRPSKPLGMLQKQANGSESALPLMTPGGMRSDSQSQFSQEHLSRSESIAPPMPAMPPSRMDVDMDLAAAGGPRAASRAESRGRTPTPGSRSQSRNQSRSNTMRR